MKKIIKSPYLFLTLSFIVISLVLPIFLILAPGILNIPHLILFTLISFGYKWKMKEKALLGPVIVAGLAMVTCELNFHMSIMFESGAQAGLIYLIVPVIMLFLLPAAFGLGGLIEKGIILVSRDEIEGRQKKKTTAYKVVFFLFYVVFMIFFIHSLNQKHNVAASYGPREVIYTDGRISKKRVFKLPQKHSISNIYSGEFDESPGEEIAISTMKFISIITKENYKTLNKIKDYVFRLEEGGFFTLRALLRNPGEENQILLRRKPPGKEFRGSNYWQFALTNKGKLTWTKFAYDLKTFDLNADGFTEIYFSDSSGFYRMNMIGEVEKYYWATGPGNYNNLKILNVPDCGSSKKTICFHNGNTMKIFDYEGGLIDEFPYREGKLQRMQLQCWENDLLARHDTLSEFSIFDDSGKVLFTSELEYSTRNRKTFKCLKLGSSDSTYLAIYQMGPWDHDIASLKIFNAGGKLIFSEVMRRGNSMVAINKKDTGRSVLLLANRNKLFEYSLSDKLE